MGQTNKNGIAREGLPAKGLEDLPCIHEAPINTQASRCTYLQYCYYQMYTSDHFICKLRLYYKDKKNYTSEKV
jgi:hypothetical protein